MTASYRRLSAQVGTASLGCGIRARLNALALFSANSLPFKARIHGDLIYFDSLLTGLTRSVLLISKGDKSEDEDSQCEGKRTKE